MSEKKLTPRVSDVTVLMGLLEDGELSRDLASEIKTTIQKTRIAVGERQSGVCSVTLKLSFNVDGDSVEIKSEISSTAPKARRSKSVMFLTKDGDLSTENSKQYRMEFEEDTEGRIHRLGA